MDSAQAGAALSKVQHLTLLGNLVTVATLMLGSHETAVGH